MNIGDNFTGQVAIGDNIIQRDGITQFTCREQENLPDKLQSFMAKYDLSIQEVAHITGIFEGNIDLILNGYIESTEDHNMVIRLMISIIERYEDVKEGDANG